MTGMDHMRRMAINPLPVHEDIAVMRSYTLLETTYLDFNLQSDNRAEICRYTMYCRRYDSSKYDTDHYSEQYSTIEGYAAYSGVPMPNTIPNQMPSQSATMPILHIMKPYEISRQRCNDP